jgi:hypothetical protein
MVRKYSCAQTLYLDTAYNILQAKVDFWHSLLLLKTKISFDDDAILIKLA